MRLIKYLYLSPILLITLAACSHSDDQAVDENLLDVVWRADSLRTPDGKIVVVSDSLVMIMQFDDTTLVSIRRPFMTAKFSGDMEIAGHLACNDYFGTYKIPKKTTITINMLNWTEVACTNWEFIENSFHHALEYVTAYEVAENRLTLYDEDHQYVLNFSIE